MEQDKSTTIEHQLGQIADMLILNGTLTECPGLLHGKMGIAIFFFHYAQHTANEFFEDYAIELIGVIQSQIHNNSTSDYQRGISGIGIGMDYLIRNGFLVADEDIFGDFDKRMYRAVMYDPWQDFSLYDGLTGYGRYWIDRFHQQKISCQARECLLHIAGQIEENFPDIHEKEQTDAYCFLHDLHKMPGFDICDRLLERCRKWDLQSADISRCFPRLQDSTKGYVIRLYLHNLYFNIRHDISDALKQLLNLDMEYRKSDMGLFTGYAGEGMLRLLALKPSNMSWMTLL